MALKIIRNPISMKQETTQWRKESLSIGLVPTMGALHKGHISLIKQISQHTDRIIVSIFVNPMQFTQQQDLTTYPRDEQADLALLHPIDNCILYCPKPNTIYPEKFSTKINIDGVALGLESDIRPNMFSGVATIIIKLFNQIHPDVAIFGEKDYQQFLVIQQLVKDLDISTEIINSPIIREENGLALSSRNALLTPKQRQVAPKLYAELQNFHQNIQQNDNYQELENIAKKNLKTAGFTNIDYFTVRNAQTLALPSKDTKK